MMVRRSARLTGRSATWPSPPTSSDTSPSTSTPGTSQAPLNDAPSVDSTPSKSQFLGKRKRTPSIYLRAYILSGHPSVRDPTEIPLVVETCTGDRKTLWTKLDTGADVNTITENVIKRLGREAEMEHLSPGTDIQIKDICGKKIELDRKIKLSVWAGRNDTLCEGVEFWIPRTQEDTDVDGVPDVLLGWREIIGRHMLMIDPEFTNEPERGLEVVAKRAEDEVVGGRERVMPICLGKKYPQPPKK